MNRLDTPLATLALLALLALGAASVSGSTLAQEQGKVWQVGSTLEVILLAFALADRFNVLRRQKKRAQEVALIAQERIVEALKSSERILETRVEERTHDYLIAKEAAESANLAKSRFLAAASHDLRQPIQAINMFCMALAGSTLDKEQKQISDYLSVSARSLGDILNSLLDISKLDTGNVSPEPEAIQTSAIFRSIDAEFAPIATAKRLRFMLYIPVGEMVVFTDPRLLQRLLGNLIGNAVKYTKRGGVLVGIRRRGQQALIQVWDTGIGIAPEHMSHIFDDYFQIGNPERDKSKGLGLGLAIAKRLAQRLGTELVCRSRLNKGSVFELRLPLARAPLEIGPIRMNSNESNRAASFELRGQRIVVIDDDEAVAKSIKLSLERQGMAVTIHGTAEQALANPAITAADFYISDLRLPGLNGAELLDALQQRSAKPIKAVILTGDTSPVRLAIARASRWPVLFKPVDLPNLISAIESQLRSDHVLE